MRTVRCLACGITFAESSGTLHVREHVDIERLAQRSASFTISDFPLHFEYVREEQE